jgi:LPS export ABC transporter permease LptG
MEQTTESEIRSGLFFERFPQKILHVRSVEPGGRWSGVFLADTSRQGRPSVIVAESGRVQFDKSQRAVRFVLSGARRYEPAAEPGVYDVSVSQEPVLITVSAESVFGDGAIVDRGLNEMSIAQLQARIAADRATGGTARNEVMTLHQKFSFPVACIVFAICGVAAGLHTRREGKMGGLTLGLAIVALYYMVMMVAESMMKGSMLSPAWTRWIPNIALGAGGLLAIALRSRGPGAELVPLPAAVERFLTGLTSPGAERTGPRRPGWLRLPHLPVAWPRLLDGYVARRYLRLMALAVLGLLALFYIGTVLDLSDKLVKGQATVAMMFEYLVYSTPQFAIFVVPMATLVAVLGTIGGLSRTGEMTVMRACGVSLYRAAAPLLLLAFVWSAGLFVIQDRVLAPATRHAERLLTIIRTGRPPTMLGGESRQWLATEGARLLYYRVYGGAPDRPTLIDLSMFQTATEPYRVVEHTYANRVVHAGGQWKADAGWVQQFGVSGEQTRRELTSAPLALAEPERFGAAQVAADLMPFGELRAHVAKLAESGFSVAEERVLLQARIAVPFITVVMTLLGVPFGMIAGRYGALYSVGVAVGLAFLHLLLNSFLSATGSAGVLPPPLAAWATNVLFLAAAGYGLLTVRT